MEKNFVIEVEVEEAERKNYLEKLRSLFLGKGFIVEREWEDNIELKQPVFCGKQGEIFMYPWIDKVYIQWKSGGVVINCSVKNFVWFRYLILFVIPVVDILFLLFIFYFIPNRQILVPIAIFMIFSNIAAYFVFSMQFNKMITLLAEEIQNLS
ncbi:MAG: hypothetical protein ACP5QY_06155 [Candidatus Hydrogenedens sp.]